METKSSHVILIVTLWIILCWPMLALWSGIGNIADVFHVMQNSYLPVVFSFYFANILAYILPLYFASTRAQTLNEARTVVGIGFVALFLQVFAESISTMIEHIDCGNDCVETIIPMPLEWFITLSLIPLLGSFLWFASKKMFYRIKQN